MTILRLNFKETTRSFLGASYPCCIIFQEARVQILPRRLAVRLGRFAYLSEGPHYQQKKLLEISELSHFIKSRCIVSTSEKYTEKHILDYSSSFNSVELTHSIISCVNTAKIPHTSFLCKVISQNTKFRN